MMSGRQITVDGRPALRFERRLHHPIERVWRAITEPAELAQWFVAPATWKPELGETFEAAGERGEITELEAPSVLAWTWSVESYRFELRAEGDGCVLSFTHVFNEGFGPGWQHAAGWEAYFNRLDAHLDGGFLSEMDAHEVVSELIDLYRGRFAARPQDVALEDGPKLRLERRFNHSPERVWRAITDPEERGNWFPESELEIVETEPPRLLVGRWYGETLRFELQPDGEGCVLVFTHDFEDRETAARTAAGWDRCFVRFQALLEGRPLSEKGSLEGWLEVHDDYAEDFGVDPEIGHRALAEHPTQG
jgi:uncharacterized protein YndB with AHSA1/START domain